MKLYSLLKLAGGNRIPPRVKILGLATLHALGRRVVGVFVDPVLSCNLRCRMCYFSDPVKRASMGGVMTDAEIGAVARALFPRALKLQIGCAAEPTLWPEEKLVGLIRLGREYGVPYISLTSNGQLIATGRVSLRALAAAGLNELTLSMHGSTPEVYENLMPGAKFSNLRTLLREVAEVKRDFPDFKLRINFTVNSLNVDDLAAERFDSLMEAQGVWPDILQLRPVQKLGETDWNDFDHSKTKALYASTIGRLIDECRRRGSTCIAPTPEEIDAVATDQETASAVIEDFTYCYVAAGSCYKPDFDPAAETFRRYHQRHHTLRALLRAALNPRKNSRKIHATKKLNYHVS